MRSPDKKAILQEMRKAANGIRMKENQICGLTRKEMCSPLTAINRIMQDLFLPREAAAHPRQAALLRNDLLPEIPAVVSL